MKTKTTFSWIFAALLLLAMSFSSANAAFVQSIKDGTWNDETVWSTGLVPASSDQVTIRHRISHPNTLEIGTSGSVEVAAGGHLTVKNDIDNNGSFVCNDSVVAGGLRNNGALDNNAVMSFSGRVDNYPGATLSNYGIMNIKGDLWNRGTIFITGSVYMQGTLKNDGSVVSPAGSHGYFEVCGNAQHNSGAIVSGLNLLCLKCGGLYLDQPGSTGDFTLTCAPFAAIISSFTAESMGNNIVSLAWTTESESNSDWFVIERSVATDGINCKIGKCGAPRAFLELGRVKAAGMSASVLNYHFEDQKPLPGLNYYRLRMIDKNGAETYSAVVDVVVEGQGVKLLAYPNPNNSILHIHATGYPGQTAVITLYSVDGKRVWERTVELGQAPYKYDMQVCDFASGVYLLKLKQGNQEEVRKLIFEK
ncbi:MAG: T9SS type A sorting domain-containing protein [Bacteroidetes bacterium]|nr:T9SS type A sorting domain-containing protein [Bacteroidota bacterium]